MSTNKYQHKSAIRFQLIVYSKLMPWGEGRFQRPYPMQTWLNGTQSVAPRSSCVSPLARAPRQTGRKERVDRGNDSIASSFSFDKIVWSCAKTISLFQCSFSSTLLFLRLIEGRHIHQQHWAEAESLFMTLTSASFIVTPQRTWGFFRIHGLKSL